MTKEQQERYLELITRVGTVDEINEFAKLIIIDRQAFVERKINEVLDIIKQEADRIKPEEMNLTKKYYEGMKGGLIQIQARIKNELH